MNSEGNQTHKELKSEKSFGYVFSFVFFLIGIYPLLGDNTLRIWSLSLALVLIFITFIKPALFVKPNLWWMRFGNLLNSIVSPVVLFVVFLLTIVPTGIVLKILRKDPLRRKFKKEDSSYWIVREDKPQPMKHQF